MHVSQCLKTQNRINKFSIMSDHFDCSEDYQESLNKQISEVFYFRSLKLLKELKFQLKCLKLDVA